MTTILKLQNAGDEATLTITGCEVVEGQYGEQVQFDAGEDRLYLPKSSADRQLERIYPSWDFEYSHIIGETLHFSRTASTKPGAKPFWNINTTKKNGAVKPTATPEKPRVTASVPEKDLPPELRNTAVEETAALHEKIGFDISGIKKELAVYQALTEYVLRDIEPIYQKAKIGMSPESAAACVATLFINAVKK